jgi:hypothetical protein
MNVNRTPPYLRSADLLPSAAAMAILTTRTAMERTHLALLVWLRAPWPMANSKSGVSTLGSSAPWGAGRSAEADPDLSG